MLVYHFEAGYVSLPECISHLQPGGPLTVRNEESSTEKKHKNRP